MRFKDTYVKLTEAVLKHPTQDDINARLASHYKDADIFTAAKLGVYNRVKELLDKGVDIDSKDNYEHTALMWASREGQTDIVKLLLDRGADVKAKDDEGFTARVYALIRGYTDILKLLKQHDAKLTEAVLKHPTDADIEKRLSEYENRMDIFTAVEWNRYDRVKELIGQGVDLNVRRHPDSDDIMLNTPLIIAVNKGYGKIVRLLVENGADIDYSNLFEVTPLMAAMNMGRVEIARYLIEHGADVNAKDFHGSSVYDFARMSDSYDKRDKMIGMLEECPSFHGGDYVAEAVLKHPTPEDIRNRERKAYGWKDAVEKNIIWLVTELIEKGQDVEEIIGKLYHDRALHIASENGYVQMVKILLDAGADVNSKDGLGNSALAMAQIHNKGWREMFVITKKLVEHGIDVNSVNTIGNTALFEVTVPIIASYLLEHGADVNIRNDDGHTVIDKLHIRNSQWGMTENDTLLLSIYEKHMRKRAGV